MSALQAGQPNTFQFNPSQPLTQMNARPDAIRHPVIPAGGMNGMNPGQVRFIQNQRGQAEQGGRPPMGMLGINNPNSSMNMSLLGGGGGPTQGAIAGSLEAQKYQVGLQQAESQRNQHLLLQQSQNAQGINSTGVGPPGGPNMGGPMGGEMRGMQFQQVNMRGSQQPGNQQMRRVQSQPQPLNQMGQPMQVPGANMIHPGNQQGGGPMPMSMNAQTGMPGQLRQQLQQQQQNHQLNLQLQGQGMSQEMAMQMRRDGANTSNPQNTQRSTSAQAQIMGSLQQPQQPGLTQTHQVGGMQPPMQPSNFQNPMAMSASHPQTMSPSPRLGPRLHPPTPANMNLTNPGQTQSNGFNFNPQQFSPSLSNSSARSGNPPFPFVPSSVSPSNHQVDFPRQASVSNTQAFHLTPAQQLQNGESYAGNHLGMPPPQINAPPRPPSNNNNMHPQTQRHPSPQQPGHQPQRPPSQPQTQPGRPPSQADHLSTPRMGQNPLPGGLAATGRIPQPQLGGPSHTMLPQEGISGHPPLLAPRPPQPPNAVAGPSSAASASFPPMESGGPQRPGVMGYPLGLGQGLTRLLQFSGLLSHDNKNKLTLEFWKTLVEEYFTPGAILKFTLWKDNQRNEAKPFDISTPILPRFFLVTSQSGVQSMSLSLDGARERLLSQDKATIECVSAAWTCRYSNGYTVTLRGPLSANVIMVPTNATRPANPSAPPTAPYLLKFESLDFVANLHDKSISLDAIMGQRGPEPSPPKTPRLRNAATPMANGSSPVKSEDAKKWDEPWVTIDNASIPGEPVNAFGIPQATMRCLELAESVSQMTDLIMYCDREKMGPIDGLKTFAAKIREESSKDGASTPFANFQMLNSVHASPAVTLYSTAPSAPIISSSQSSLSGNTLQNGPSSVGNSPQKQHKTIPQAPSTSQNNASSSSTAGANNTPAVSNSTLKRKQTDTASPTTGSDQAPPAKRTTRNKRRTTGGGG